MKHMLLTTIAAFFLAAQIKAAEWQLVWSDEFNSSKLDYSKWNVSVDAFGGGNQGLRRANVVCKC